MSDDLDQTIIVRFVLNDVVLDERRFNDIDEVPDVVEIDGAPYSTIGTDVEGRAAWHSKHGFAADGTSVYRLTVLRQ